MICHSLLFGWFQLLCTQVLVTTYTYREQWNPPTHQNFMHDLNASCFSWQRAVVTLPFDIVELYILSLIIIILKHIPRTHLPSVVECTPATKIQSKKVHFHFLKLHATHIQSYSYEYNQLIPKCWYCIVYVYMLSIFNVYAVYTLLRL